MKTKNNFKVRGWKQNLVHWTGVVALSFAVLISCQKKDSSNTSYVAPVVPLTTAGIAGQCVGCSFAQVQLGEVMSEGTSSFPVRIFWRLIGDQVRVQQMAAYGSSVKNYSGAIAVTGEFNVLSQITVGSSYYTGYASGCVIPAGVYQINTLQVGNATNGSFTIPQFEAVSGATRVIFTLGNATLIDPNADGVLDRANDHLYGQLVPVAMTNGAAQIQCNDPGIAIY